MEKEQIKATATRIWKSHKGQTYIKGMAYLVDKETWAESEASIPPAFVKLPEDSKVAIQEPEKTHAQVCREAEFRQQVRAFIPIAEALKIKYTIPKD